MDLLSSIILFQWEVDHFFLKIVMYLFHAENYDLVLVGICTAVDTVNLL